MLSPVEIAVLVITMLTLLAILSNRLPIEVVALLLLLTLGFTGIVSPERALSGFGSAVVITLLGLFVITKALEDTGVVQSIADRLNQVGKGSEVRLITVFMLAGAALSLVMNNVAAGAVLLPATVQVARISKVRVSKLLIPMSFGTLVGGMATYLTTANIVMSTLLEENSLKGLVMMDFIPTGGLIVAAAVVYMVLVGRHLLPDRQSITQTTLPQDLRETYQLGERLWEIEVLPESKLAGVTLTESAIGEQLGLTVLAIWRGQQAIFSPMPSQLIRANDVLLILGREERLELLLDWGTRLRTAAQSQNAPLTKYNANLTEVIIPPRSAALGQTLTELRFRDTFGVTAVALWREGRSFRTDVGKMALKVGDALLVVSQPDAIKKLALDRNYLVPISTDTSKPPHPELARTAIGITAVVLLLAIFDLLPLPLVMLGGAVAMVIAGCLKMEEFYEAVEWRVIFLVAGMLPLSIALTDSGLAQRVGLGVVSLLSAYHPLVLVMGMFLLTVSITQVMGGQVTAVLVGPIAISAALQMNISPQAMAVAVSIACSTAFLTPIAHPVNILMMGPGGYQFEDFFKVGVGMTLVTLVTLMLGMVLFWGV